MQWTVGIINTVALWVFTAPAVYILAVRQGGGLEGAWSCLWPPYLIMDILIFYKIAVFNWEDFSEQVRKREGLEPATTIDEELNGGNKVKDDSDRRMVADETTQLLS
mmetsp:Transcript_23713/g.40224  ORF Transcript_23713/g.40224 Transcript_23713/m.40224 type:complete len:107 (-) Transcript_23713:108-428(-)